MIKLAAKAPVTDDDTVTELDALNELLDDQQKAREKAEAKAPAGFDPAALFLLRMRFDNLFDPMSDDSRWRCRGCQEVVRTWDRESHHEKHKRAAARGDIKAKEEARMGKGATETARRQREERAESRSDAKGGGDATGKPDEAPEAASGAEKASGGGGGWRPSNTDASQAILDKLVGKLSEHLEGVEAVPNTKVGYASIRLEGKLIGYGWLTSKPQLRLEAAIEVEEVPEKLRGRVMLCKRSATMRARTVVADTKADYDLALAMLKLAARKALA